YVLTPKADGDDRMSETTFVHGDVDGQFLHGKYRHLLGRNLRRLHEESGLYCGREPEENGDGHSMSSCHGGNLPKNHRDENTGIRQNILPPDQTQTKCVSCDRPRYRITFRSEPWRRAGPSLRKIEACECVGPRLCGHGSTESWKAIARLDLAPSIIRLL